MMIAALFVIKNGPYFEIPDVDPWDEDRDARLYRGPHKVIAHPPCARWGRYWFGGPSATVRRSKGDDDGCFESALRSVRKFGGVLEHPAHSSAWRAFSLFAPPRSGGWIKADTIGWTCCVDQGHYGHRAQKATWLYVVGTGRPELKWGKSRATVRLEDGFDSADERVRKRIIKTGMAQRLSHRERALSPDAFRDLLLEIARS